MKVKEQKKITFNNTCNCIVDYNLLESAILWYQKSPTQSTKKIYIHGNYPAVSIHYDKIHVHRLIMLYLSNNNIGKNQCVHHINGNKLDATILNLEVIEIALHQSMHNKGKVISEKHKLSIIEYNKKNKGRKIKKSRTDVSCKIVYDMVLNGYSFNKISKLKKIDWGTVKQRYYDYIHENPELLK